MTIPRKLWEWAGQPGTRPISAPEQIVIRHIAEAFEAGVGYGWMQQIIEWMWQERCGESGAWGPEWFNKQIRDLEAKVKELETALAEKH